MFLLAEVDSHVTWPDVAMAAVIGVCVIAFFWIRNRYE